MKGFLRRSLDNARGAEQRLKPLTGSLYAGNYRRPEFAAGSWVKETDNFEPGSPSASGAEPAFRQHSQPGISQAASTSPPETLLPATPDPREAATGGHASNRERQQPSSAFDSPIASHAAPPHRESAIRPAPRRVASEAPLPLLPPLPLSAPLGPANLPLFSSPQPNQGSRAEARAAQVSQQISQAETNRRERRSAPSILPQKAEQQKVEPRPVESLLRPAVAAMRPRAEPRLSLPISRPPQEPEIQVHIGRIEVIAAVPQPPRVPSPRPNRATSLADYLAGRNGRP